MSPRIGSLFSGYGGLDMAVQAVYGGEVVWYSEIDKHACTVLKALHPAVPNLGDITAVDWAAVPSIDILTGGYPCQPFSHAGQRKGTNDERHLWPYVRDAIVALRPVVTVLENVDGHRSLGLDVVLGDLADLGLSARWGVVRAADAGAPHGRKRVFIVVTDSDRHGHGIELHAPGVERLAAQDEGGPQERQRPRTLTYTGSLEVASDTGRLDGQGAVGTVSRLGRRHGPRPDVFGMYAERIALWESILGRVAPDPVDMSRAYTQRLNPRFVEFLMGLPDGHVTGHDLGHVKELKMLGNGVVPQQAELALRMLAVAA